MTLHDRELGTILAALRYWQRALNDGGDGERRPNCDYDGCMDIATDSETIEPLSADEIDDLCEEVNSIPMLKSACEEALERFRSDGWPLNDANTRAIRMIEEALQKASA
jgi:hypothetical protein